MRFFGKTIIGKKKKSEIEYQNIVKDFYEKKRAKEQKEQKEQEQEEQKEQEEQEQEEQEQEEQKEQEEQEQEPEQELNDENEESKDEEELESETLEEVYDNKLVRDPNVSDTERFKMNRENALKKARITLEKLQAEQELEDDMKAIKELAEQMAEGVVEGNFTSDPPDYETFKKERAAKEKQKDREENKKISRERRNEARREKRKLDKEERAKEDIFNSCQ